MRDRKIHSVHVKSIYAARLFILLTAGAVLFQVALLIGLPWGELAWGGAHVGTLPDHLRAASAVSALVLTMFGFIVSVRAGLILPGWKRIAGKLVWVVVAYYGLGVIANAITPSAWERIIWLPVCIALFISSIAVARGDG
jgi:hypothetical protein